MPKQLGLFPSAAGFVPGTRERGDHKGHIAGLPPLILIGTAIL